MLGLNNMDESVIYMLTYMCVQNRTVDGASNTSRLESSFYSGHTTYGGASAVKQLNTSVPIMPYSVDLHSHDALSCELAFP